MYYPSVVFLPSVALGALLTTNFFFAVIRAILSLSIKSSNEQCAKYV